MEYKRQLSFFAKNSSFPVFSRRSHQGHRVKLDFAYRVDMRSFSIFSSNGSSIRGIKRFLEPYQTGEEEHSLRESKKHQKFSSAPHALLGGDVGISVLKIFKSFLAVCYVFIGCFFGVWVFSIAVRSETLFGSIALVCISLISIILTLKWTSAWYSP